MKTRGEQPDLAESDQGTGLCGTSGMGWRSAHPCASLLRSGLAAKRSRCSTAEPNPT